jgi:hypothetical protein
MSLVLNSDFTGKYKLALTQFNTGEIDAYIAKYEKEYLLQLLGAELYALFIADLNAATPQVPVSAIYLSLFNAFNEDDNKVIRSSDGMVEMLKGFIYYQYTKDLVQNQTPIGSTMPKNENSTVMALNQSMCTRFNDQVLSYQSIQWYICDNSTDYPLYNGQKLKFEYFL